MGEVIRFPEPTPSIEILQIANPTDEEIVTGLALMSEYGYFDISAGVTDQQRINYLKSRGVEGPPWPWQTVFEEIRTQRKVDNSRVLSGIRAAVQFFRHSDTHE